MGSFTRRDFMLTAAAAAAGLGLATSCAGLDTIKGDAARHSMPKGWSGVHADPIPFVRIGFVGCGNMGTNHIHSLCKIKGAEIRAVCDIDPKLAAGAADIIEKAGYQRPRIYDRGPRDFERLCAEEKIDIVFIATPWEWHVPMALAAMKNGKHAAVEVPIAQTAADCWRLIETSEKTNRHCMMLENCCYGRSELSVLNLVRSGALGELLHAECGYNHDLRSIKLWTDQEGLWRWRHSIDPKTGNLYPTHGLGPVMWYMNINHGDAFDYLVSMSTPARGMNLYKEHLAPDDPRRKDDFQAGDINTSLIKTKKGYTIYLVHDCNNPRPYSRINMIQGTKGLFSGYPDRVYIDGRSPMTPGPHGRQTHDWEDWKKYQAEYEHELYKKHGEAGSELSHGGMDYIEDFRLIRALQTGRPLDMDIYDACALSCIVELSSRSLANMSQAVRFPDFTRGAWKTRRPVDLSDY